MRIVSTLALGLALAGAGIATQGAAKDPKPAPTKYTPAVQTALVAAQNALKANDAATAAAKVAEAKQTGLPTDDDKYSTGSIEYQLYKLNKDQAALSDGIDLMLASGKASADLQSQLYVSQGTLAYQNKDYRKAEAALLAAQKAGSTDANLIPVLVSSMANNGETLQALTTLNAAIDQSAAAGKPVSADWFQQGISLGYRAKGTPAELAPVNEQTSALTKKWVAAYPTKANWHDALAIYRDQNHLATDVQVDVFRLLRAANAMTADVDYREYAEDTYLRFPQEAMTALQEGSAKGVVNLAAKNDASEILALVKGKVAGDKGSLPAADKSARAAANGKAALFTADAYVGYGSYAPAIELYKLAVTKGQVDLPTVYLHMGWAQALSGDAAGAKASFAQVTGVRKTLADFWVIHLDHATAG